LRWLPVRVRHSSSSSSLSSPSETKPCNWCHC
jgi:hypothetical protein